MSHSFSAIVRCSLFLLALSWLPGVQATPAEDSARALHLLSYIGADYPNSVAAGQIADAGEYQEQLEFLAIIAELLARLPTPSGQPELSAQLADLKKSVEARAEGAEVAQQARALATQVAITYNVQQTPQTVPNQKNGAALYAQHCALCHGQTGAGDGPVGVALNPAPANLRDAVRLDHMSLYDIYNTLTLGVQGTGMVSFAALLNEAQRWDLASAVAGFTAGSGASGAAFSLDALAGRTPAEINQEQGAEAAARFRIQRAQPPLAPSTPAQLIELTQHNLTQSLIAYREGRVTEAYTLSVSAYLEGFELIEQSLNNLSPELRKSTEQALIAYRQAIQNKLPISEAEQRLALTNEGLRCALDLLQQNNMSAWLSFVSSLLILLREGLEAILILAAILAFLHKTGQQAAQRSVHIGWAGALVAGLVTWMVAAWLLKVSGAARELIEGFSALFASLMLVWIGIWMHNNRNTKAWQAYLERSMLGVKGRFGFGLLAFIAVYRELFEVILFYETLWLQAGISGQFWVVLGAIVAGVILLGLAWLILRGAARLPFKAFFSANALLMCALAVIFAGHGVSALQEAGRITLEPVGFIEVGLLGIYPDAFSLSAQAFILALIGTFYGLDWYKSKQDSA